MLQPDKTQYIIQIVTGKTVLDLEKMHLNTKNSLGSSTANYSYKYRKDVTLL